MAVIIYILCHDEKSQKKAELIYGKYNWYKIVRIDNTLYMESWFLIHHVNEYYDEIQNYEYIGMMSYSAHTKILLPNLDKIIYEKYDVIPFITSSIDLISQANMCHPGMVEIINEMLNVNFTAEKIEFHPCNYWIMKKEIFREYVTFIQDIHKKMDKYNDQMNNSTCGYNGSHSMKNDVLKVKKDYITDQKNSTHTYTMHCFILERMFSIYCHIHNLNLMNYTAKIMSALNDEDLFFSKKESENAAGKIIKYTDFEIPKHIDNHVYVIQKNNIEGYPDIICNGDSCMLSI